VTTPPRDVSLAADAAGHAGDLSIGLYIVGDEILSGKRVDRHFAKTQEILAARGLALAWVSYLGDDRSRCVSAVKQSLAGQDLVFSCGGIGATPDDHTRQAVAEALGRPLVLHPEAKTLIEQRCVEMQQPVTQERLRMGEFPEGAEIIPNPYNRIPGFSVHRHYFLPGFPVMAWPMMEWVLDTFYASHFRSVAERDMSMTVKGLFEASVTRLLEELTAAYPTLKIYSLPSAPVPGQNQSHRFLELGVKAVGTLADSSEGEALVAKAYAALREGVSALGGELVEEHQICR
jgi:molybdopterin-biosynthesis enzyme MoeA-like protein